MKQKIQESEKQFYRNNINREGKSFEIINGSLPILISAPHTVKQLRNKKLKGQEVYTGGIAIEIAKKVNCFCIYKKYLDSDDANYDIKNNQYKKAIEKLVKENNLKMLLDIHGARDNEKFDIDIGTDNLKNLNGNIIVVQNLIECFNKNGISKITIDGKFKADTLHTISKTIAKNMNIPCMQIEISRKYREIDNYEDMKKVIDSLIEFILGEKDEGFDWN